MFLAQREQTKVKLVASSFCAHHSSKLKTPATAKAIHPAGKNWEVKRTYPTRCQKAKGKVEIVHSAQKVASGHCMSKKVPRVGNEILLTCQPRFSLRPARPSISLTEVTTAIIIIIIIIIIIYPLTARVVGAPQMILRPVFSICPCSPLPSGTCRTPGLSIP